MPCFPKIPWSAVHPREAGKSVPEPEGKGLRQDEEREGKTNSKQRVFEPWPLLERKSGPAGRPGCESPAAELGALGRPLSLRPHPHRHSQDSGQLMCPTPCTAHFMSASGERELLLIGL